MPGKIFRKIATRLLSNVFTKLALKMTRTKFIFSQHRFLSRQKLLGFTILELVVTLVILGVLSASALPKFINFGTEARRAKFEALAGSMRSGIQITQAAYLVQNPNSFTPGGSLSAYQMAFVRLADGSTVSVFVPSGYPGPTSGGIFSIVPLDANEFTMNWSGVVARVRDPAKLSNSCMLTYTSNTGEIALETSGC